MTRSAQRHSIGWLDVVRFLTLLTLALTLSVYADDENPASEQPLSDAGRNTKPLGTVAPDWAISVWSDGKARSLGDYKGKVVFIDFWGIWCGPCRRMIPALKDVEKKYVEENVVFLSIHTPGSSMAEIMDVLKQESWSPLVGQDSGQDTTDGVTAMSYGIRGYPTIVIIDQEGLIAYNSTDAKRRDDNEMKALAKEIGLPWPIDQGIEDNDQLTVRTNQLTVHMLSIEVDNALRRDKESAATGNAEQY